jgi:hypothetical protein
MGECRYSSTFDFGPCRFTPGERAPGTHWIEGWVGPRVDLEAVEYVIKIKQIFIVKRNKETSATVLI